MCLHSDFLDEATCSVCIHGLPGPREIKPDDWWIDGRQMTLVVDPSDALVDRLLSGDFCPRCMTSRAHLGCACSRQKIGRDDWSEAAEWLESVPELATELGIKFTEQEAAHVAASVQKRILRRMDLTDDERADEVMGMKEQFGIDPKWFPVRRNEPTHLPI